MALPRGAALVAKEVDRVVGNLTRQAERLGVFLPNFHEKHGSSIGLCAFKVRYLRMHLKRFRYKSGYLTTYVHNYLLNHLFIASLSGCIEEIPLR
jgi:hypothetical protein